MGIHLFVNGLTANAVAVADFDFQAGDAPPDLSGMSQAFAEIRRKTWRPKSLPKLEVWFHSLPVSVLDGLKVGESYDVSLQVMTAVRSHVLEGRGLRFEGVKEADRRFQRSQSSLVFGGAAYGALWDRAV